MPHSRHRCLCCHKKRTSWQCCTSPRPAEGWVRAIKVFGSLYIRPSGQKGPAMIDLALVMWANLLRHQLPVIKSVVCIFNFVSCRKGKLMGIESAHGMPCVLWDATIILLWILTCLVVACLFNIALSWSHITQAALNLTMGLRMILIMCVPLHLHNSSIVNLVYQLSVKLTVGQIHLPHAFMNKVLLTYNSKSFIETSIAASGYNRNEITWPINPKIFIIWLFPEKSYYVFI